MELLKEWDTREACPKRAVCGELSFEKWFSQIKEGKLRIDGLMNKREKRL